MVEALTTCMCGQEVLVRLYAHHLLVAHSQVEREFIMAIAEDERLDEDFEY